MKLRNINLITFCFVICLSLFSCKENQKDTISKNQKEAIVNALTDEFTQNLVLEGLEFLEKGEAEEALSRFYEANEIEPKNIYVLNTIANVEYQYGDFRRAIELYKTNIDSHPEFIDTYLEISRIFIEKEEASEAVEILKRGEEYLLEEDDKKFLFYYSLAQAYFLNNECDYAKEYLEKASTYYLNKTQKTNIKKLTKKIKNNCS